MLAEIVGMGTHCSRRLLYLIQKLLYQAFFL
ncbi:hypothetical protein PGTDC60_1651 [Porphyromonas gingivalis TDC60]|uniref:Uncharacterized protein n=1 Tax=Porphyromonas gingivalis (strain ATCC 33277 / DSM 20709 / CIP 103683 / JCM 12257 / NCTC 11834 / 2561) TaxID=431947 RepID=B2RKR2_PORG3|nr:hypothetical protein SJDPG4_01220 [Porphyromonas gingivalis SJD4]BAG33957.1 hypothetical protein PGN_1438 [Porphyromonas gingivalis ATCC 33277]BAK25800.1 hypothetical protein PGTDC60_1651 [Porphyromonas gingivalis TDC60]